MRTARGTITRPAQTMLCECRAVTVARPLIIHEYGVGGAISSKEPRDRQIGTGGALMALSDPSSKIQSIIDDAVSDHMGMAVYVFTDFDGSGAASAKFFSPSKITVWDSSHNVVSAANLPNTLFEIGSVSKVFTSRIFYRLQGTYDGNTIGSCMPLISLPAAISGIPVADIVTYASGFPQDNGEPPRSTGTVLPGQ
jgi:beta-lactamase class C